MHIFETFEGLSQTLWNSSCQFWRDKSIPLQILHYSSLSWHFYTHFILSIKGSHQGPNLQTFECSNENLLFCPVIFPNFRSVFLQCLHHSSVSRKISPLYFFSSNIIYFGQRDPSKVKMFETFGCLGHIPHVHFETTSQFVFKLFIILQCHYT